MNIDGRKAIDLDLILAAQHAGNLAAAAARMGGLSSADISAAYNTVYDAAISRERQRMPTTELGKIERGLAQKIKDMEQSA